MKAEKPLRSRFHRMAIPPRATRDDNYDLRNLEIYCPDVYAHLVRAQIFQLELELIMDDNRLLIFDYTTNCIVYRAEDYRHLTGAEIRKLFALRFQSLLWWSGWRQSDLAEEVDCTQPQISSYLRGETLPNIVTMIKIANAFDCSLDCFRFVDLGE